MQSQILVKVTSFLMINISRIDLQPSILDNITNWRIFEDDEQIIKFLHSEDTFKGSIIDDEHHEALLQALALEDMPKYNNIMPKNIIRLEKLFDIQDKFKRPTNTKISSSSLRYEAINLGIEQNPWTINLGTNGKERVMQLLHRCRHPPQNKTRISQMQGIMAVR